MLMWTIDEDDNNYHYSIIARKERELANNIYQLNLESVFLFIRLFI